MSIEQDVDSILVGSVPEESFPDLDENDAKCVKLDGDKIRKLLETSGIYLCAICLDIERASIKEAL